MTTQIHASQPVFILLENTPILASLVVSLLLQPQQPEVMPSGSDSSLLNVTPAFDSSTAPFEILNSPIPLPCTAPSQSHAVGSYVDAIIKQPTRIICVPAILS